MHHLALARYRLLTTIRRSTWVFAVLSVVVILPHLLPLSPTFERELFFQANAEFYAIHNSMVVLITFAVHWIILISACSLFGSERALNRTGGADLMDTVPVRPAVRFHGDTLGIFATAMVIHLAVLPLLAFSFAFASFTTPAFFWVEATLIVVLLVISAGASWRLHARPRSPVQAGVFWGLMLLLLLIVRFGTRWVAFRDGLAGFATDPAPHTWAAVVAGVDNPALLVAWLLLAALSAFAFFQIHTVYALQRSSD